MCQKLLIITSSIRFEFWIPIVVILVLKKKGHKTAYGRVKNYIESLFPPTILILILPDLGTDLLLLSTVGAC